MLTESISKAAKDLDFKTSEPVLRKEFMLSNLFLVDYYVPEARLVFEVNGKNHFYPITFKKCNVTRYKSKILRNFGK